MEQQQEQQFIYIKRSPNIVLVARDIVIEIDGENRSTLASGQTKKIEIKPEDRILFIRFKNLGSKPVVLYNRTSGKYVVRQNMLDTYITLGLVLCMGVYFTSLYAFNQPQMLFFYAAIPMFLVALYLRLFKKDSYFIVRELAQ